METNIFYVTIMPDLSRAKHGEAEVPDYHRFRVDVRQMTVESPSLAKRKNNPGKFSRCREGAREDQRQIVNEEDNEKMMTTKLGILSLVLNALSCFRPASYRGWFVFIELLTIINTLYFLLSVSNDNLTSRG